MQERQSLSAQDWITAGFRALAVKGAGALKAEALARDLRVSKGSFYWHFRGVPALHRAMLDAWESDATEATIIAVEAEGGAAADRLARLLRVATSDVHDPFSGLGVEAAIRDWARHNDTAREVQARCDRRRIDYLSGLLREAGQVADAAAQNARLLYAALVGLQAMGRDLGPVPKDDMLALLAQLLGGANGRAEAPQR